MHQHILTDLVERDFLDVLGDLNMVSFLMLGRNMAVFGTANSVLGYGYVKGVSMRGCFENVYLL